MILRSSFLPERSRPGVAAMELAVLLPFLTFIFLVTVDFCRVFYYSQTVHNCARNGALYASNVSGNTAWEGNPNDYTTVQAAAMADGSSLSPPMTAGNVTVSNQNDADGNSTVRVTINYQFQTITNYPGIPSAVDLLRTVQMRAAPNNPDPIP